ncbi:hypothetical protein EON65_12355 [archaeon]|nr:MAG: hypothetical protein EON65_12355 [archaeon]
MEGQHSVVRAIGLHHIAITVSDVGVSTSFYADIVGLRQIKRPDFNRYGAWFDAGNVQLHLIKGEPCVPNGGSLIIPHFALEVQDPDALYSSLKRNNIRMDINKLEYNKGTRYCIFCSRLLTFIAICALMDRCSY